MPGTILNHCFAVTSSMIRDAIFSKKKRHKDTVK